MELTSAQFELIIYLFTVTISRLPSGFPSCHLYCQRTGSFSIHSVSANVTNGASCLVASSHQGNSVPGVCVAGECVRLGCDDQLNSYIGFDQCGVWCGHNDTCVKVNTSYIPDAVVMGTTAREGWWEKSSLIQLHVISSHVLLLEYTDVVMVPKGSKNIKLSLATVSSSRIGKHRLWHVSYS